MTLPVLTKTWVISPNNRLVTATTTEANQKFFFGVKNFLKARGYVVKGSCSAGTGAMDGVDRWSVFTDVTPTAGNAVTSQAWFVLTDGNGCDILLAYQSNATTFRVTFSPGGLFVAASTANQQPTATDEQVFTTGGTDFISSGTGIADRLWFGWASSDRKACRFWIAQSGSIIGQIWGVEAVLPSTVTTDKLTGATPVAFSPPVWGFNYSSGGLSAANMWAAYLLATRGGLARVVVASVATSMQTFCGVEGFQSSATLWGTIKPELQAAVGYPIWPLSLGSDGANSHGKIGNLIDWWIGRSSGVNAGDVYGNFQLITNASGVVWPWDGVTQPQLT
jgi:hypothetical protein